MFIGGDRAQGGNPVTNVTFTDNVVSGAAGTTASGLGNLLVSIDANGATLTGNQFTGTTGGFQASLRVGGSNTTVGAAPGDGNTFAGTAPVSLDVIGSGTNVAVANNTFTGTNSLSQLLLETGGVAVSGNTFTGAQATGVTRVAYTAGAYTPDGLYDANTFDTAVSVRSGGTFDASTGTPAGGTYLPALWANVQGGVNAASDGNTVHAYKGVYNEGGLAVNVGKTLTLEGARTASTPAPAASATRTRRWSPRAST